MKKSWEVKKLGEVCEVFADGDWIESKDQSSSGIRLVQTGNVGIGNFKIRDHKARYISESTFKRLKCTEIFEGDCLVSRLPDPVGRACLIPDTGEKMITAVDCTIIRFDKNKVLPKYFNYYSQSFQYLNAIKSETTGTTRDRISRNKLGEILIPIPLIPEQKKIVSILDQIFSEVTKAKENAEKNLISAKEILESYFQSVFKNKGEGWTESKLGEVTLKIGSGATPRGGYKSYKTKGVYLIRSMNVHDRRFKDKKIAFIDDEQAKDLSNVTLQKNDVLFNITGASIARCCIIPDKYLPARVNQHVSIIRPKQEILDSLFLNLLLTTKFYKDQLLFTGEQGATRQAITKVQLQNFVIHYPSLKEQNSIVAKLNSLSHETKKLEELYERKLADLEELKKSTLQKAFKGELLGAFS